MIKSIDALGYLHPRYPRNLLIELLPKGWGVGILIDPKTFGKSIRPLYELLHARPDIKLLRLHGHWDALHNQREQCIPLKKLKTQCNQVEVLAKSFLATEVWYSWGLEYNCSDTPAIQKRLKLITELAPSVRIVQSRMKGWASSKYCLEKHDPKAKASFVSTDGIDLWDIDYRAWLNRNNQAIAAFGWSHSQNGREKGKPPKPYAKRDNWPDRAEFKRLVDYMRTV